MRLYADRAIESGFTLVEILVVLAVIGIGLALIALSAGQDSSAALRSESERLRSVLEHAAQIAQWRHSPLVWEADAGGYRFSTPTAEGTLVEETDPTLASHPLPADIRMRATDASGAAIPLRLMMRASGRNDPYAISIESAAGAWTISGDPLNRVVAVPAPSVQ